jgi:hypothetical protein
VVRPRRLRVRELRYFVEFKTCGLEKCQLPNLPTV